MNSEQWQKIKEIFDAATQIPVSERRDFVGQFDEYLQREVFDLLESHDEAANFIENSALSVKNLVAEESPPSVIGKEIGAYKIESEIGDGGMGAVYLATRADKEFEKRVAVKLIKRGLDTDEIIKRFRNERQILAALEHPNITRLIDGGATEDGLPYLVMDYVEGEPLTEYCERNCLSIDECLKLFLKICSAVKYAHQNLIIHRDLKPSNVLVTKDGTPKLLDFGIAKLIAEEAGEDSNYNTITRRESLKIRRRFLGENHPDTARTMGRLGGILILADDKKSAESLHRQALSIFRKNYGEDHPDTAVELINLVGAIHQTKPNEAEKLALEALQIRRKIFGENHPDTAWAYYNLAFLAGQRGDNTAAAEFAKKVLEMRDNNLPNEHPSVGGSLLVLGKSLLAEGKSESAKKYLEECLALREKTLPENHYLLATVSIFLGECLLRLNETENGKQMLFESYENLKEKLGENHEQTQIALSKIKEFFPSAIV